MLIDCSNICSIFLFLCLLLVLPACFSTLARSCVSLHVLHSLSFSLSLSLSLAVYVFDARTPLLCANEGNSGGVRAGLSPSHSFSSTGFCMTYDLPYCHGTQAAHVRAYRRKNARVPTRQRAQPRDRREKERLSHQVARAERPRFVTLPCISGGGRVACGFPRSRLQIARHRAV